jgi:signal transduction histidine kinase
MHTFGLGNVEAAPIPPRRARDLAAAGWAAPGVALAGTITGSLAADACGAGLALPVSGLALTLAGALLWLTGLQRERRDRITLSIAAALALLAMAALQQLLVCALGREGMLAAELLQAGGLVLLFVGLMAELDSRRHVRAVAIAVAGERRRLARELHDGVAQELAYIRAQSRRIEGGEKLVEAADRALEESRAAISGLVRPADEPLAQTIEAAAISLGERHGVQVVCDLSTNVQADDATRGALLRILREAVANAARHSGATSVWVELRAGPRLSVTDDGRGFDPSGTFRPDSLGLASMRERTESLGGHFALRSEPDSGTCVQVALA